MTETLYSPMPFRLEETGTGFLLFDALGDSIAALAGETGDHPYEEQRANAILFRTAPELVGVLEEVLEVVSALTSGPLGSPNTLLALQRRVTEVIAKAEGRS